MGDPRFHALLKDMGDMHDRKQQDYGVDGDPFANVRASEQIGIPAWKGCYLRLRDKVKRLDAYCLKGSLANESAEDSFLDLAVYAAIALILHREARGTPQTLGEVPPCEAPRLYIGDEFTTGGYATCRDS